MCCCLVDGHWLSCCCPVFLLSCEEGGAETPVIRLVEGARVVFGVVEATDVAVCVFSSPRVFPCPRWDCLVCVVWRVVFRVYEAFVALADWCVFVVTLPE